MTAESPRGQASPGPAAQGDGLPSVPLPLDQAFDASSLFQLRAAVAAHASAAGLGPSRVYDIVTAAHELAANAIRHGAGHGRLHLHSDGEALYCQVTDDGQAGREESPGHQRSGPPSWPVEYAHGLWVIGKITDQFSIDHGPAGTIATARFTINPPLPPGTASDQAPSPDGSWR